MDERIRKSSEDIYLMLDLICKKQADITKLEMLDGKSVGNQWKENAINAAKRELESMKQKMVRIYKITMGVF